jgi:3-deoxy-manno-octulosonate cytidylyltransferase (CMP-KDO synthetase)
MSNQYIIIPARLESKRLNKKLLLEKDNKPLLYYTWQQCCRVQGVTDVIIVTDSEEIKAAMPSDAHVFYMDEMCHNGTERISVFCKYELKLQDNDKILGVQAEYPNIAYQSLENMFLYIQPNRIVTLYYTKFEDFSRGEVRIALDRHENAKWFSRTLPYHNIHVGVYGYRADTLREISALPSFQEAELENLEQLPWLYYDYEIKCLETTAKTIGIDFEEDYQKWISI